MEALLNIAAANNDNSNVSVADQINIGGPPEWLMDALNKNNNSADNTASDIMPPTEVGLPLFNLLLKITSGIFKNCSVRLPGNESALHDKIMPLYRSHPHYTGENFCSLFFLALKDVLLNRCLLNFLPSMSARLYSPALNFSFVASWQCCPFR